MKATFAALVVAMTVFASLVAQPGYADVANDYWVESHAGSSGGLVGARWDYADDPSLYPASAVWDATTAATAEFGGNHAGSVSSLSDGVYFTYNYADATWYDNIAVYNPLQPMGAALAVCFQFDITGTLCVVSSGIQPADTVTEGRAAVSATVTSDDLAVTAHGYNLWTCNSQSGNIMRLSGNWDLGGSPGPAPSQFTYADSLLLSLTVPNGRYFDLSAKISVGTGSSISYVGAGSFGGLSGFGLTSTADFRHSMLLGGITDENGTDISSLGYIIFSQGPTYGGPHVIPEPGSLALVVSGLFALAGLRIRRPGK